MAEPTLLWLHCLVTTAYISGAQSFDSTSHMSGTESVCQIGLSASWIRLWGSAPTPPSLAHHDWALGAQCHLPPPSVHQDWVPGDWHHPVVPGLCLKNTAPPPPVPLCWDCSVHWDQALDPVCRAQGSPWIWRFCSRGAEALLSCHQICGPIGSLTD